MIRALIAIAVAALFAVPVPTAIESRETTPREFSQISCQEDFGSRFIHKLWESGANLHDVLRENINSHDLHIGVGLTTLLYTIRASPDMSRMTESEFVELAARICEPVFEVFYKHNRKNAR